MDALPEGQVTILLPAARLLELAGVPIGDAITP
jgi:hypothetical protein